MHIDLHNAQSELKLQVLFTH